MAQLGSLDDSEIARFQAIEWAAIALLKLIDEHWWKLTDPTFGEYAERAKRAIDELRMALKC